MDVAVYFMDAGFRFYAVLSKFIPYKSEHITENSLNTSEDCIEQFGVNGKIYGSIKHNRSVIFKACEFGVIVIDETF